ncbi:oxygenase [Plantactinospora sp. BB1]|nr:oxygenase [Plantactinospora sp. BB1]
MTLTQTTPVKGIARIALSNESRDALFEHLKGLPNPEPQMDWVTTLAHKAFATLPAETLQAILDFGRHVDTPGVTLVENLPVDLDLPPTPSNGGPCVGKSTYVAESVLLGLSGLLGEPVSFLTEKDGRAVHDIIPTAAGAQTQTSQGSDVFLNFHNDIVHDAGGRYDVSNPDFLVLNCLRPDLAGEALTAYADARDLTDHLDDTTIEVLRSPLFQLNAPGGYTRMFAGGREVLSEPVPLLTGPAEAPEIAVAANGVRRLTPEADAAFDTLQKVARHPEVAQIVSLRAGQALLINNRKGIHARSRFTARYDGKDRWLQRTYVRRSLWNIRDRVVEGSRRTHR